jgi:hypothetical protein
VQRRRDGRCGCMHNLCAPSVRRPGESRRSSHGPPPRRRRGRVRLVRRLHCESALVSRRARAARAGALDASRGGTHAVGGENEVERGVRRGRGHADGRRRRARPSRRRPHHRRLRVLPRLGRRGAETRAVAAAPAERRRPEAGEDGPRQPRSKEKQESDEGGRKAGRGARAMPSRPGVATEPDALASAVPGCRRATSCGCAPYHVAVCSVDYIYPSFGKLS